MKISLLSGFLQLIFVFSIFTQILAIKKSYIVYLGSHTHGSEPSSSDILRAKNSHYNLLGSFLGSTKKVKDAVFIQYTQHINGFGAMLEENEAAAIAKHPDVVSVFLNKNNKLHTTRSWDFLGLVQGQKLHDNSAWNEAKFGEDVIIANIDTGISPESKSFSDTGYGPVPSRWKGQCQQDKTATPFRCNRKLIGARYFTDDNTARDDDGHGSHTISTAAGNFVNGVSVDNQGNGTAKGGSPKARIAVYKACFNERCSDASILAAFDAAISDGVDVISASIGHDEPSDFFEEAISIGAFHATMNNIKVVCSAGNGGPTSGTVTNGSPWIFTVAASTMDRNLNIRHFKSDMEKTIPQKIRAPIMGDFSSRGPNIIEPRILKPDVTAPGVDIIAAYDQEEDADYPGNILPYQALSGTSMACPHVAGIVGLLKSIYPLWSPAAIRSAIMTTATSKDNYNESIQEVTKKTATPFAYGAGHVQPNLAADPGLVYDLASNDYLNFLCATGYNSKNITAIYGKAYECPKSSTTANFNYPSITAIHGTTIITRRLKNVGPPSTYKVAVESPAGVSVSVTPSTLQFAAGEVKSFSVTFKFAAAKTKTKMDYAFGSLVWSDGKHFVRSPIVVK